MIVVLIFGIVLSILIVLDVGFSTEEMRLTYCPMSDKNEQKRKKRDKVGERMEQNQKGDDAVGISDKFEEAKDFIDFESLDLISFDSVEEIHFSTRSENFYPATCIEDIASKIGKSVPLLHQLILVIQSTKLFFGL